MDRYVSCSDRPRKQKSISKVREAYKDRSSALERSVMNELIQFLQERQTIDKFLEQNITPHNYTIT